MCDEAVNDSSTALKPIPNWFVISHLINKLFTALYTDQNILYFNEDSGDAVFNYSEMVIVNVDLSNINHHNFDEDYPDTIILVRLLAWHIKFENAKPLKKDKWRINASSVASQ